MKISAWKIAVFVVGAGVLAALVVVSGVVPIKASSGHWAITEWFLHFSMKRSVSTHSFGIDPPSLDDPAMVLKGAGHYEIGCRACHGSPAMPQPRIAQQMTPKPPFLPPETAKWDSEELFYLVKHGLKFTGMPAWPSQQRDDEVWAMVAFLRKLPDLSPEEYRRLVRGETDAAEPMQNLLASAAVPAAVTRSCMPCHGTDGLGRGTGAFPKLAGQRRTYLHNALTAYANGERHSGIMQPIAASLTPDEVQQVSGYYSGLAAAARATLTQPDPAAVERGRLIAEQGLPNQRVPSCVDFHGQKGSRQKDAYPRLTGQYADYLVLQLELIKKRHRGGSPYEHVMHKVADRLKPEQMRDVALYFESLPSDASDSARTQ